MPENLLQNSLPPITTNIAPAPAPIVQEQSPQTIEKEYAGVFKRLSGFLIDGFFLGAFFNFFLGLTGKHQYSLMFKLALNIANKIVAGKNLGYGAEGAGFAIFIFSIFVAGFLFQTILSTVGLIVYYVPLTNLQGQTLGKRVVGVKVVKDNGSRLSLSDVIKREFIKLFIPFSGLWILFDTKKQGLLDKIAGTVVVKINKNLDQSVIKN